MTSYNKEPFDFAPLIIPLASDKQVNIVLILERSCQSVEFVLGLLERKKVHNLETTGTSNEKKKNLLSRFRRATECHIHIKEKVVITFEGRCWWKVLVSGRRLMCWMIV